MITVEGLGDDTAKTLGIAWWLGAVEPPPEYQSQQVLVGIPGSIDSSIDPRSGSFSLSSFTFQLSREGLVGKRMMWHQGKAPYQLTHAISADDTTLVLSPATSALLGQAIFIEDETFLCSSYNGGGEYVVSRGFWGSVPRPHDAKRSVFTAQPHHKYRFVRMGTYGEDQAITWRWRGYIAESKTNAEGVTLLVQCRELLSAQTGVEIARAMPNLADQPSSMLEWAISLSSNSSGVADAVALDGQASVELRAGSPHKLDAMSTRRAALYADGAFTSVVQTIGSDGTRTYRADEATTLHLGSQLPLDEDVIRKTDASTRSARAKEVREIAVWSRALDEDFTSRGHDPISPTYALGAIAEHYRYHPLAIACALLLSTSDDAPIVGLFDVMGPGWGGGLSDYASDSFYTNTFALIDATRELQIDELVLRWEDAGIRLWDTVYSVLLRPYGFFLTFDTESNFGFDRFRYADIADYDSALGRLVVPIPRLLEWDSRMQEAVGAASARIGGARPWSNEAAAQVNVEARGVSARAALWDNAGLVSYDFSTQPASSVLGGQGPVLDVLVDKLEQQREESPVVTMRVEDATYYRIGAFVLVAPNSLRDTWFIDPETGEETQNTEQAGLIGQIVSMRFEVETHTYVLGLMLTNFGLADVIRWRAPSMEITSVDEANRLLGCAATSVFGFDQDDARSFSQGQRVQICNEDGSLADPGVFEITAVGVGFLELDDFPASLPKVDQLVRLASVSEYSEEVHARITRTYVYFGEGDLFG